MRVSLRRIAEETGVSINTVSQILNRKGASLYRAETRDAVLAAAQRLGYRPNASARFMLNGRFDTVALLQAESDARPLGAFAREAVRELQGAGLRLLLAHVDPGAVAAGSMPAVIAEWMTDGFIIDVQPDLDPAIERLTTDTARPAVLVNHRRDLNAVFPDDRAAAEALTAAMIDKGLGNPAYVDYSYGLAGNPGHYSEAERRAGWAAALLRLNRPGRVIGLPTPLPRHARFAAIRAWLTAADRPRAVVVGSQTTARIVVAAALASGLRVPEDLAVGTFAEEPVTDLGVPVDTWVTDRDAIGREAAAMLVRRISAGGADEPSLRIAGHLVPGIPAV